MASKIKTQIIQKQIRKELPLVKETDMPSFINPNNHRSKFTVGRVHMWGKSLVPW